MRVTLTRVGRAEKITSPMNKSFSLSRWYHAPRSLTSAGLFAVAVLGATFWFVTTPFAFAQDPTCTICHKRTTTLTLACDSLDYRRHIDHGDTMGACAVTPTENP